MTDSGASATSIATPSHPPFDNDDSLMLSDYGLPELRASPNTVGTSPANMMGSFADFDMTFAQSQGFGSNFDGVQPKIETGYAHHRGSIGNMSEEGMSGGGSAHPNRMSIGGSPGRDGSNTSPESGHALGMLGMGEAMNEAPALAMKLSGNDITDHSTTSRRSKDDTQDPPLWSEMKTKAGKERKRLPLACIACRRKKIRCSGEKPACKHCLRSRIPCVYKVTTRKAAPRTDYMAMLDKRLKRMEDRVIKLIPKESLPSVVNVGRSVVKPAIPGAPPKTPTTKKRQAEEAFGNELDEWSKAKGADPTIAGSTSRGKESDESKLLTEGAESLPSKDIQEHLAEVYFDFVYGQSYPLLHKPSFMRRLATGKVPPVLILAMCAISARFSNHPQLRTEPCFLRGDNWAERAREIALKRYDAPNITILIVYLLLGLHEFGTCQGGRSWMFGGMAQRMAYALQLHKENEYDPLVNEPDRKPLSATDREIRRRTMWSCFLMDRFNSSGTDRPLFVHEQYIEVQLPVKEHLYIHEIHAPTENLEGGVPNPVPPDSGQLANPRDNMGVSAYTIRLVCTWGKLIKYMNLGGKERESEPMWSSESTFHAIKKEAKEFKAALPEMLVYSPENLKSHAIGKTANSFLYLHILWQQIMLFMHRFALPSTAGSRPPKDMPHDFLTESARAALDAANQISILINEAMDHNVVAPFAGYSAFFSSTVHVHGVFSKNPKLEAQSKKYLAYNVKYLTKMKKYWGMFHYIAENLKELYRQHADAQLKGPTASCEKKGSIFQYGDWFDRYPHGVSKTDYEDAAESNQNEPGTDAVLGHKSDLQSVEEFFASLSPPSKSDQQRKQARKNKSKSISKPDLASSNHTDAPRLQRHNSHSQQSNAARLQAQQHMNQANMASQEAIEAAIAAGYDPTSIFAQLQQPHQSSSQQFLADFASHHQPHHSSLPLLNTSPTMIHPSHAHQMDPPAHPTNLSPFPDLAADFNNGYWNLDALGLGPNSNFFDPMSSYFVPFNVDPPPQHNLGDDGVFAGQGAEAYGFALGAGTPVDLDLMHGVGNGGMGRHRGSVSGARPSMGRRGTGTGLD
ncbi:zinc finger transcription factor 1 [Stemphylium lycopersici]|uniref:Zinc finger transcription factor 1 n=1 Tax=Stemphylium lycopersici TaxID=183478 RepID=A0A364N0U1_STELY|nr:zinc finger transcription factor 1 [Stemphylium lycopersici]